MQIHYLEIVTNDVDAVRFGGPDAARGNARTASLRRGGLVGVRAPLL